MHANNVQKKMISKHDSLQPLQALLKSKVIIQFKHANNKKVTRSKKGKRKVQGSDDITNEVKIIKKLEQPNWEHNEVVYFVQAKRDLSIYLHWTL